MYYAICCYPVVLCVVILWNVVAADVVPRYSGFGGNYARDGQVFDKHDEQTGSCY